MKRSSKELCVFIGAFLIGYGIIGLVLNCVSTTNSAFWGLIYLSLLNPFLAVYMVSNGSIGALFSMRTAMQVFSLHDSSFAVASVLFWLGPFLFVFIGLGLIVYGLR